MIGYELWGAIETLKKRGWSNKRLASWADKALCPATGLTVRESWEQKLRWRRPVGYLPTPFDVVVTRPVHKDCMVCFEGPFYPVPFPYVGQQVEVRGCIRTVEIWKDGKLIREYPQGTPERILSDLIIDEVGFLALTRQEAALSLGTQKCTQNRNEKCTTSREMRR